MRLPTVSLDTTISELYHRSSPSINGKTVAQVVCGVNSTLGLSDHFPPNTKYLYHDGPFATLSQDELHDGNLDLQRSLAIKYLAVVSQRDAFIVGSTPVILFDIGRSQDEIEHGRREVERTLEVLHPSQRARLLHMSGPSRLPLKENKIDILASKLALDALEEYPLVFDLEKQWYVNSKEALASSGLPTPKCEIVELVGCADPAMVCCESCQATEGIFIPPDCVGTRGNWLKEQTKRVLDRISERPLPFVVKNQQAFDGAGTYIITSEEQRSKLLEDFSTSLLRKLFSQINASNSHLKAGNIVLSDLVKDPVGDYGLTFFVTADDGPIFLAVSEQVVDSNHAWTGSIINYGHQKELKERLEPIMDQISRWLRDQGYVGPVGADVLETRHPANSKEGGAATKSDFHIVDLNVRISGSFCLPLMRTHFESRGLPCASSFSVTTKMTRSEFIARWRRDFEAGRMCILSWYEDENKGVSMGFVTVGREDPKRLQEQVKKVKEMADSITF